MITSYNELDSDVDDDDCDTVTNRGLGKKTSHATTARTLRRTRSSNKEAAAASSSSSSLSPSRDELAFCVDLLLFTS